MTTDGTMRASDHDRESAVEVLRDAYTAGRLNLDEFDERTTAAYAAKTWGPTSCQGGDAVVDWLSHTSPFEAINRALR